MKHDQQHPRPSEADLQAARLVLDKMGVEPTDLLESTASQTCSTVPTFAEYLPIVSAAVSDGTRRVYQSYWNRILAHWSTRRLDEPSPSEIKQLAEHIRTDVIKRRNARGGRSAAEHLIAALRCLYQHAHADGWVTDNPARQVPKPRRLASTRQGLPDTALAEINHTAATTGNDPTLDTLLLRLHTETACRRGGALALAHSDLDPHHCLIGLHEKGETTRWQPVSPTLMHHLREHAAHRTPETSSGRLLRYRTGTPITHRRYDHLWHRLGQYLPWVATQQISTHWLRHTTLTWVERHYGYGIARAYAGHNTTSGGDGTTTTYIRAGLNEVATALAALTDEPHPLAPTTPLRNQTNTP